MAASFLSEAAPPFRPCQNGLDAQHIEQYKASGRLLRGACLRYQHQQSWLSPAERGWAAPPLEAYTNGASLKRDLPVLQSMALHQRGDLLTLPLDTCMAASLLREACLSSKRPCLGARTCTLAPYLTACWLRRAWLHCRPWRPSTTVKGRAAQLAREARHGAESGDSISSDAEEDPRFMVLQRPLPGSPLQVADTALCKAVRHSCQLGWSAKGELVSRLSFCALHTWHRALKQVPVDENNWLQMRRAQPLAQSPAARHAGGDPGHEHPPHQRGPPAQAEQPAHSHIGAEGTGTEEEDPDQLLLRLYAARCGAWLHRPASWSRCANLSHLIRSRPAGSLACHDLRQPSLLHPCCLCAAPSSHADEP